MGFPRCMDTHCHCACRAFYPSLQAIKQLQSERPYFLPPIYERERVERAPVQVGICSSKERADQQGLP